MRDIIGSEPTRESGGGRARMLQTQARRDIASDVLARKRSAAQVTQAREAIDEAFDEP